MAPYTYYEGDDRSLRAYIRAMVNKPGNGFRCLAAISFAIAGSTKLGWERTLEVYPSVAVGILALGYVAWRLLGRGKV